MPSILLFGATGLMGSHLVSLLKKTHPTLSLTVYIRNTDAATTSYLTSTIGVDRIVHGDFSESDKIAKLAAEHEFVINCGSSWEVPLSQAIIKGLKSRVDEGKSKSSLIHISGTGNFLDGRHDGKYAGPGFGDSKVWSDSEEDMKLVNADMLNGACDVEVIEAGNSGKVNSYIIFPSGIYGQSLGPVPGKALGVIQYFYKLQAEEIGFVPYIGDGSSIFQSIHVEDFPPFVNLVLNEALKTPEPTGSVYTRMYIISSQATNWKETSSMFAKVLHAQGVISSPEARSVTLAEAGTGELPNLQAGSMLLNGERAKRLGWNPVKEGVLEYLQAQLDVLEAKK